MPKKIDSLIIRVEGGRSSEFPLDMLRYDRATPFEEKDSATIRRHIADPVDGDRYVKQAHVELIVTANSAPCVDRWSSFGWLVTHIYDRADGQWRRYSGERIYR